MTDRDWFLLLPITVLVLAFYCLEPRAVREVLGTHTRGEFSSVLNKEGDRQ